MECIESQGAMFIAEPDSVNKEKEKCDKRLLQLRLRLESKLSDEIESAVEQLKIDLSQAAKLAKERVQMRTTQLVPFLDETIKEIQGAETFNDVEFRLEEKWHGLIDEWKSEIWCISKALSVNCTQALVAYKKRLVNFKIYPMDVINVFIENSTSEINKVLICNQRDYLEIELHLRKVYGAYVATWHKKQAFKLIQAIKISKQKDSADNKTVGPTPEELVRERLNALIGEMMKPYEEALPEPLMISHLILYLSHLGLCKEHIVHYHEQLFDIVGKSIERGLSTSSTILHLDNFEALWTDVIGSVRRDVQETYKFVSESIRNWNFFVVKLQKIECTASKTIHGYRKNCTRSVLVNEENMNVLFDKLREASDLLDLRISCDQICSAFKRIEQMKRSMKSGEDRIHQHSTLTLFTLYDLLVGEWGILEYEVNTAEFAGTLPVNDIHELELAQFCLQNAKNWLDGFRDTIKILQRETVHFLNEFLRNWLAYKKGESEFFLKLDIERLNQRTTRIVQNILEVRWTEISEHHRAFDVFNKGIDAEFQILNENAQKLSYDLTRLDEELDRTLRSYNERKPPGPLSTLYMNQIEKRWRELYRVKKMNKIKQSKEETARVYLWLNHLAVTFLRSVKLFGDGGNYSAEEAETLVRKINSVKKKTKKHRMKILSKFDTLNFTPEKNADVEHRLTSDESICLAKLQTQCIIDKKIDALERQLGQEIKNGRGVISILNELLKMTQKKGQSCALLESIARILADSCQYFGLPRVPIALDAERIIKKGATGQKTKIQGRRRTSDFLTLGYLEDRSSWKRASSIAPHSTQEDKNQENGENQERRLSNSSKAATSPQLPNSKKSRVKSHVSSSSLQHLRGNQSKSYEHKEAECTYNYLYSTKTLILTTFTDIKDVIERTYVMTYHAPEEYTESLKEEYLRKMRKINLNVEFAWNALLLEFILTFLRIIQLLPECANLVLGEALDDWSRKKTVRMNELEETIESFNIEEEKKKVDNELKPSHGHPLNKFILQQLLKKVYQTCKDQLTRRKVVLEKFQDEIIDFWSEQQEAKATLVRRTTEINDLIFDNPEVRRFVSTLHDFGSWFERFDDTLLSQMSNTSYLKYIKDYLRLTHESAGANHEEPAEDKGRTEQIGIEELEELNVNLVQFFKNLKAIYKALHELIETGYFPPPTYDTDAFALEEEEFTSTFIHEFQKKIESSHKTLKSEIVQSLQECKKEFDDAFDNLTRWKDEWIYHVKNVIRLYSVDPILEGPRSSVKRLVNNIKPRNAVPYNTLPFQ